MWLSTKRLALWQSTWSGLVRLLLSWRKRQDWMRMKQLTWLVQQLFISLTCWLAWLVSLMSCKVSWVRSMLFWLVRMLRWQLPFGSTICRHQPMANCLTPRSEPSWLWLISWIPFCPSSQLAWFQVVPMTLMLCAVRLKVLCVSWTSLAGTLTWLSFLVDFTNSSLIV